MRFNAPERGEVSRECFQQPVFKDLSAFRDLLEAPDWPEIDELDQALRPLSHGVTGKRLHLVRQETLADHLNYEIRIFREGAIATRSRNWHDLLNALVWKRYAPVKSSLNACQVEDMLQFGVRERSRRQYACTQFDEAGAIVVVRDRAVLESWDRHDWTSLFLDHRQAWLDGSIAISVFGHALFEHALDPGMLLVSKTLVILDEGAGGVAESFQQRVAEAIQAGVALRDPQHLRPLPLAGIPGWHSATQDAAFYREVPCFRPVRAGRVYPEPLPAPRVLLPA